MNKPELQTKAKSLGIDTEGLNVAQLQEAIAKAEAKSTEPTDKGTEAGDTPAETVETNATGENKDGEAVKAVTETADNPAETVETNATEEIQDGEAVKTVTETVETNAAEETQERPFFKDNRKRKFAFKVSAPATINIDGVILSQQEILEDEEIMYELILGSNSFIEPVN